MNRGNCTTIECRIKLAPFAGRHNQTSSKTKRLKHLSDHHRIRWKHLAKHRDGRAVRLARRRRLNWSGLNFLAGVIQHSTREHVLGLSMGRNTEPGHINADNTHTIDLVRQQPKRHT